MRKAVVWTLAALASGFLALPAGADEDDDRDLEQRIEKLEKLFQRLEKKIDRVLADRPGEEKDRDEKFEKKVEPPVRLWLRALPEGEDRDRILKLWRAGDDEDGKPDVERLREAARRLREHRFEFKLPDGDTFFKVHPVIPGLRVLEWNAEGKEAKVKIVIDGKTYEGTIRRVDGDRERADRDRKDREDGDREHAERDKDKDKDGDREHKDRERGAREDKDDKDGDREHKDRERGTHGRKDREDGDREHKDREDADRERRDRERKNRDKDKDKDGDREERDFLFEWRFEDGEGPDVLIPADEDKPRLFLRRLDEDGERTLEFHLDEEDGKEGDVLRPRVLLNKVVEVVPGAPKVIEPLRAELKVVEPLPAEKALELTREEARRVERELDRVRERLKEMERQLEEEEEEF
ncbi:MAG: hypothetical protein HY720_23990 [Planctomycetes bacterium]|nr:hypothetical protein [Planctomycetota bacterium]